MTAYSQLARVRKETVMPRNLSGGTEKLQTDLTFFSIKLALMHSIEHKKDLTLIQLVSWPKYEASVSTI